MPQRGYGLQPRVAASATLGTSKKRDFNRNAVASFSQKEMHKADATALRLRTRSLSFLPTSCLIRLRRRATAEFSPASQGRDQGSPTAFEKHFPAIPALGDRAKVMPALRVEDCCWFFVAERRLSLARPLKAGISGPPKTLRRVSDG